jgi:hypothetical protein
MARFIASLKKYQPPDERQKEFNEFKVCNVIHAIEKQDKTLNRPSREVYHIKLD